MTTIVSSKVSIKTYAAASYVFDDGDSLRHNLIRSEKNLAAVLASKASHVRRDTVQARQPSHKILRSKKITGQEEKNPDEVGNILQKQLEMTKPSELIKYTICNDIATMAITNYTNYLLLQYNSP